MNPQRRTLLKGAGAAGTLAALLSAGLLKSEVAYANTEWNKAVFASRDYAGVLKTIGAEGAAAHQALVLDVPAVAVDGATIITATSNIPNTSAIYILVRRNPFPLAAHYEFAPGVVPKVQMRLRVAETSLIQVVARAEGKVYAIGKEVTATAGGCI